MYTKSSTIISILESKLKSRFEIQNNSISIFLNPYSYLKIRNELCLLKHFDSIYIDGIALKKILKMFKIKDVERVSFDYTSIADKVFNDGCDNNKTFAIIGSTKENVSSFVNFLRSKYTNINIDYYHSGFFSNEKEKEKVINNSLNSDIVICGMGTPLQEKFLKELKVNGFKGTAYSCGGFIHQTSSTGTEYYPNIINKLNIRFMFRMYDEPKLVKRYLVDYPIFIGYFLYDLHKSKRTG